MATATDQAATGELKLTPPDPVPTVQPERAAGLVPVADEAKTKLQTRVDEFVEDLVREDSNSPEFGRKVDQITNMGRKEIAEAAGHSNRFLDRPIRAMDKEAGVGADLAELRRTVEDLDPSTKGNLSAPRKLFGIIPMGSKLRNYFDSYKSAQGHISSILTSLQGGKDELLMDNAAIDVERQNLWAALGKLEQMIFMSKALDTALEQKAADLDHTDPAKAKAVRETALFYVRQRTQDLLTQLAVSVQGYLALDLVKKNNVELIKGVDRASTTTVGALRTAVTVAQAMANQKLVLDQITALNTTTARIIDATGQMLKDNTARIHEQAAGSTIPLETLSRAFQNIYDTMDSIDAFKLKALDSMKQTVTALEGEVGKSKAYIARSHGQSESIAKGQPDAAQSLLAALD
ncbi:toxic anion resistance family protein [Novosphingobium sp. Rr 2-17]|uniref:toxic anion resistance protein n=1 Tax=Novosphingobium sp. Rr 2-17 TaxID=555793 RepID=UPI0002699B3B|nr:toxic anion resistance protein [Novosphingobium sp. Rr 2-17]EIZ81063.1 toxic anion resistance family protein [Novosphingobium sp. Rr 2-17]